MKASFTAWWRLCQLIRSIFSLPGLGTKAADYSLLVMERGTRMLVGTSLICLLGMMPAAYSQTDLAPGDIMFTGFNSDAPDAFSFVLLNDVVANTTIFITDRGWDNTVGDGFRIDNTGEGTIQLVFNAAYPCGTEVIFTDTEDANDWDNPVNQSAVVVGTVTIVAGGDVDGVELGCTGTGCPEGDQLFIYQSPLPTPGDQTSFVAAINVNSQGDGTGWNTDNNADANSEKPSIFDDVQVVAFPFSGNSLPTAAEFDNVKYDCSPNVGTSNYLQSVISNANDAGLLQFLTNNNWQESDNAIALTACNFCCLSFDLSAPELVLPSGVFTIYIDGVLPMGESWELWTAGCGAGSPIQTTTADSFNISAPGTEQTLTYYVRPTNSSECAGACATISVCVENSPYATCNTCTGNVEACNDCLMPDIGINPDLDSGCFEIKLIFILDESGSIGGNAVDVENGVIAFLEALNGQDIQMALIEFSDVGRLVTDYTPIDNGLIMDVQNYFDGIAFPGSGHWYFPSGGTNWHDAMVDADALESADILMFFTDGVPTVWSTNGNACGNGSTTQVPEIVNPVKIANQLKTEGTHMFMLGVGGGIDEENLSFMSGPEEYVDGVNTIGTSDFSIGNFVDLAEDLADFVSELCFTPLDIDKQVLGAVCNGRQEFMFIIHNPGTESAVTVVEVIDTFPSGYTDIQYNGTAPVKLCIESQCDAQGHPVGPNAFLWTTNSLPPGESDTLILSVEVLAFGTYTNVAWASASNAAATSDTVTSPNFVDDLDPIITCPPNVTVDCAESTLPASTGVATGTDPDGSTPDIVYEDVTVAGTCPQLYIIERAWTARDGCDNTDGCIQIIIVEDETPPQMNCPIDMTLACNDSTLPVSTGMATSTDLCDTSVTIAFNDVTVSGSCLSDFVIERTWTSTDDCANSTTCIQIISIADDIGPVMTCPANVTIACTASSLPSNTGSATASDVCDASLSVTYTDSEISGSCPQEYSITRTWSATDDCGNISTCVQGIVFTDDMPPSVTCPSNATISCSASTLPANTGTATSSDNCDGSPAVTYTDVTASLPSCSQEYTITRTWRSEDDCGNFNTCNQIITIDDSTGPSITCPANVTISCTASTLPANTGSPLSADNCDGTPVIIYMDVTTASPTCSQEYTIARTWRSTDDCGNFNTCVQTIVIDDSTAPVITCPVNITVQCTASTLPNNTGIATGTDNCDVSPDITFTDVTIGGSCPQERTITRTWRAQDDCGNFSTCNQIIFVDDSMAPAVTCPANVTIQCTASTAPANTGTATGTDDCDATPAITFTDVTTAGACPQAKTITRTWRAQDDCGNFNTCNQVITIIDDVAPSVTCPANVTIQCTASTMPANTGTATGSDNCDAMVAITSSDVTVAGACQQAYTINRTWQATDDCNNSTTCIQVITIIDNVAPVITCPANITIQCTASTLPANTGTATASDNCDASLSITYSDINSAPTGCPQEYVITRTWQATDDCSNSSTCIQTITIEDTVAPSITCPANVTIECTASTLPSNTGTPVSTDNCDPMPSITYADVTTASPSCPQEYSIARTWTATDTCGNSNTCVQAIAIHDTNPPDITCPADITILCTASTLPANTGTATATDNCDPIPDLDYIDITQSIPGSDGYLIERTWTAIDACGNDMTCLQEITVDNPLDPEILGEPFDTICSGGSVVFEAYNQGIIPTTYQWSFGSGSNPSMAMGIGPHNVGYTYNASNGSVGAFVVLTVTTPGCPPVTDTVANINVNAIPNANITSPTGNPCVLQDKTFQPQAPMMPGFSYSWSFGAGASIPMATGYGPHTLYYTSSGPKVVQLIVWSNEAGSSCGDTSTFNFTVNLCPGQITGRIILGPITGDTLGLANVNVRLFADANLDGIQDNSTAIKNVFSNSTGLYSMATVTPGYYVIVQTQPNGYFSLWDDDITNDFDSLSNLNPNDNIIPVTIEPNEIDSNNYFVEVANPGIITGYVFEDFNGSQTPQPAEGIPGTTIDLWSDNNANGIPDPGGFIAATNTNAIGFYTFGGLSAANYVLVQHQPAGYNSVKDFDPSTDGDVVPNTNMTNDTLPLTISNSETDEHNYFIEISPCGSLVTTTQDNVPGSLRFLINCAESGDTIGFHPTLAGQTLHLNAGQIVFDKDLHILSTLTPIVTIQSDMSGAFKINPTDDVVFKNLYITSGLAGFPGAAFENYGHLTLWDVNVYRNPLLGPGNYLIYNQNPGMLTVKGMFQLHQD